MNQSKTWWGQRFIDALCKFTDSGRLARGKAYSSDRRILQWHLKDGKIEASIRGNTNPYFGVTKEPRYTTTLRMTRIPATKWQDLIRQMSARANIISRLMMDDMPENIESVFASAGVSLLPDSGRDFKVSCSCPDYSSSCKHIAGVIYRLASVLDHDPLLLFELRGLNSSKLRQELSKYPLGKALAASVEAESQPPRMAASYFTKPRPAALPDDLPAKNFWYGEKAFPKNSEPVTPAIIPALTTRKAGDYPEFWHNTSSFTDVMSEFYDRLRKGSGLK